MTKTGAYRGDPAIRDQACACVRDLPLSGWTSDATADDRRVCAEAFGLAPELVGLLGVAAGVPYRDHARTFLLDALASIAPGSDTAAIVRDWMIGVWNDPTIGIEHKLAAGPALAPARRIVDLVGRSGTQSVMRAEWRFARSTLFAVEGLSADGDAYAQVAAAMAWNSDETPEVAVDVWTAWRGAATAAHGHAAGWSRASQDAMFDTIRSALGVAYERLGPPSAEEDGKAGHQEATDAIVATVIAEAGLTGRHDALTAYWDTVGEALESWERQAMATVLAACSRSGAVGIMADRP